MANPLNALKKLSQYAGNRYDLVQAGGGNASVKKQSEGMFIKASGVRLSEVNELSGFVKVNDEQIRQFINSTNFSQWNKRQREHAANQCVMDARLQNDGKPSIETLLHAILDTYTLHTHPIAINAVVAKQDWLAVCEQLYPDALFVTYATPGIDLALAMQEAMISYQQNKQVFPQVVFLQNHGLIVSCDRPEKVIELTEHLIIQAEKVNKLDLSAYRMTSIIANRLTAETGVDTQVIYSSDTHIQEFMHNFLHREKEQDLWPFCPDTLVYCGVKPLIIEFPQENISEVVLTEAIKNYKGRYQDTPKVIFFENAAYTCGKTFKKAQEAEELLRFHCMLINKLGNSIERLTWEEVRYLSNWDAEKYRQGV
ncbi:MAG: class II aldolase/adducin family protein [Pseudomonadota bacterium]